MQVKDYPNRKAANLTLLIQVRCAIVEIKGEVSPCPESAAVSLLGPGNCNND
jgi:hypothetical protein